MIAVFARGKRFCDGFLAGELKDGTIQRVLRRLAVLLTELDMSWR